MDLTEIGVPYGTATYAAPEQAARQKVDHRADIFSTGVLLYEMLAGIWPFQGKTLIDVRYAVLHAAPKPLAQARPEPRRRNFNRYSTARWRKSRATATQRSTSCATTCAPSYKKSPAARALCPAMCCRRQRRVTCQAQILWPAPCAG